MPEMTDETGEIIQTPFIRTQYNYNRDAVSLECGHANDEPTMTQQQFKDECDINTILERFGVTGELPTLIRQPLTEDFVEAFDFQTSMNAIREATNAFNEMPAKVRARFGNDPAEFIKFFEDPENEAEARKLGLMNPKTPETPAPDDKPAAGE